MKRSYLTEGVVLVIAGICFISAAVLSESVFDGLLWGFGGASLVPGLAMIIRYYYWSSPRNAGRYKEILDQKDIIVHDELNEKLRDRSGRISYLIGLVLLCISEVVFAILGKMGIIADHKIIVLYLFGMFVFQITAGSIVFHYLKKKY